MYAPSLSKIADNQRRCPHCNKQGGLTYQKSEKEQTISGIHFSASPPYYHCNFADATRRFTHNAVNLNRQTRHTNLYAP
jgi:hypothetical protein